MFEADFARLARVQRVLRWSRWLAAAVAVLCIAGALLLWPGAYARALAFGDIQIHLDLSQYFAGLGVQTSHHNDAMVLGMRFEQVHALLRLASIVPAILAIAGLFRARWREVFIYGAIWYALTGIPNAIEEKSGWEVAIPQEFGVRPPEVLFAMPTVNSSFGRVVRQLDGKAADARLAGLRQIARYYANQPGARLARAARIRAEFASDMSDLNRSQKAAMHYTAAQVAYLEQDHSAARDQLNAIVPADFHPTYDADYRIRRIQEWVEATGGALSPDAYRPQTGWPLSLLRLATRLLALLGVVAFIGHAILVRLGRQLSARLKRMQRMADELGDGDTPPVSANPAGFQQAAAFGRRPTPPLRHLETETSV